MVLGACRRAPWVYELTPGFPVGNRTPSVGAEAVVKMTRNSLPLPNIDSDFLEQNSGNRHYRKVTSTH